MALAPSHARPVPSKHDMTNESTTRADSRAPDAAIKYATLTQHPPQPGEMAMAKPSSWASRPVAPLLLALAFALAAAGEAAAAASANGTCYSHLFVFGDSLSDTGNFIRYSAAPGSVSRSPYGETFFRRPTGRWSDGRLVTDFIAEGLKLPYWTPYLDGKSKEDFRYGANFAVASGTALNQLLFRKKRLDVSNITPYSLGIQIGWFRKVLRMLASTQQERKEIMARSLFLVGEIGANDYNHPLFQNKTLHWVAPLVPRVIRAIGLSIEALIELGAKTLYVPGTIPLGCLPRFLFFFQSHNPDDYDAASGCLKWLNRLAVVHNNLLKAKLDDLRRRHPDVSIVYVNYYDEIWSVIANPMHNGFDKSTALDACCGGGGPYNANFTRNFCSGKGTILCPDPSKYVSWDGLHYTEAVYKFMARGALDGPFAAPPILSKCKS